MPIGTPTYLGHNGQNASSSDLTVTLSGAIPTGALAFCSVAISRSDSTNCAAPSSVSGGGVTWDLETSHQYDTSGGNRASLFIYRAYGTSPSGTTVTITPGYTSTMAVGVCYVTGTASGSNGASAILQEVTASAGAVSGGSSLASAATATLTDTTNNGYLYFTAATSGTAVRTFTPDAAPAFTEITSFDFGTGTATLYTMQHAAYAIGISDASPSLNSTASSGTDSSGIVAYEIAAATAPSGLTITSVNTTNTAFSAQTNSAVIGTGLSASVVCTYAGIACTNESASSSTSLKITFPNFFTNNIKLGRNYEFKVVG